MKQTLLLICLFSLALFACGGGNSSGTPTPTGPTRTFMMGTTPFFASTASFPDWQFDDLSDKDILSIHVDDFWGVPWLEFRDNTPLPPAWVAKWANFANMTRATGKPLYLALSPLGNRRTLAPRVKADGTTEANWAPADGNGCYAFSTDVDAASYQQAYLNYVSYVINLVQPTYVSPAIEINIPFSQCAADKAAWVAWYNDVHNALKASYPSLVMFPTFQMEHMYGIADAQSACVGITTASCFDLRLTEALTIPGDRIAFSTYPIGWKYRSDYQFTYPTDTYTRVTNATGRKIWIAETGWAAVKILQSYQHTNTTCGADLFPDTIANDTEQDDYLAWLLTEAQNQKMETVIWWLNRDYLDGDVATTCPCTPANSDTCQLAEAFYTAGGATGELLLRLFGNMALRNYDGSGRPSLLTWQNYLKRRLALN